VTVNNAKKLMDLSADARKTYHEWMKSPELLELTASEPLTLDEELEMQRAFFVHPFSKRADMV
jgi:hypothetical protein